MTARPVINKLASLHDVEIASPADGDALVYDSADSKWKNTNGGSISVLPASNGSDDTTAIQSVLDTAGNIAGKRGASYIISAPLVLKSNTSLDMRGCTITLKASSDCRMVQTNALLAGGRDHDIHVIGGLWDRGANGGAVGTDRHSIVFRLVDRCSIRDASFASTGGKFSVLFQNATEFVAERLWMRSTFSDGVHIEGPANRGLVLGVFGSCGDDMVAITPKDYTGYTWGDEGDVTDVLIDGVFGNDTSKCLVKLAGGNGLNCKGVTVRTVHGTSQAIAVQVGDDTANANTTGGLLDDITLDDIKVQSASSNPQIKLNPSNGKRFTIRNLHYEVGAATGQNCISLDSATSIAALEVSSAEIVDSLNGSALVNVQGTCTSLIVANVKGAPVAGAQIVKLDDSVNATVSKLVLANVACAWQSVGGSIVRAIKASGQTLTELHMANVAVTSASWVADLGTTTAVHLSGVSTDQGTCNVRATGVVTVRADQSCKLTGSNSIAAGGSLNSKGFGFGVDVSLTGFTKAANDTAYNTNAALACGAGPVISNGTSWKHLYTGNTV